MKGFTTPGILETGCTKYNLRSGRDGVIEILGLRPHGRAHGRSRTIEEVRPTVKAPEVRVEGIGEE